MLKEALVLEKEKTTSIVFIDKNYFYALGFCEKLIKVLAAIDPIIVSVFAYANVVIAHK